MKLYCESCKKSFVAGNAAEQNETACPDCGKTYPLPQSSVAPGVVLGDFLIESEISKGGMGVVYLARQISLDRHVALKVLQSKHIDDKEYVESLYREARAAAKINHPNVVQAYAIGEDDGIFYFAMEYVRGDTFKQILKDKGGKLEFKEAAKIIRDVARALSAAWKEQKLVHQDIKPDNIMLDANGFAKLADLGLARSAASVVDEADEATEVLGTPQYISPEQLTGVPTDVRSDIYSLGATFYQFVTGRYAYVADSLDELPRLHVEGNLEPPKNVNPELPDALNSIIVKMMARLPENRYQNPEDLVEELEKYINDTGKPAAPRIGGTAVPKLKIGSGSGSAVPAIGAGKTAVPSAGKGAKAPLSLNLNGTKAASASKPAATLASKPAAAPVAPKPATPPAAPPAAKPATPPAAPPAAKPATPPAAPPTAKPATPPATPPAAKPATPPATPPAAKPATPPATPPAAKPAETPAVKPAETPAVKTAPAQPAPADKKSPDKAKAVNLGELKEKIAGIFKSSFKWVFIGIGAVLILGIAFVTTVMILNSKGKLPAFLAPVGNFLNSQAGAAKAKAIELAKPQAITKEEVSAGPVTRPEYLKKIEELLNFRLLNPQDGEKFLAMADEAYADILNAVTPEEIAARDRFLNVYSPVDEKIRCDAGRKKIREKYLKKLDQAASLRLKAEKERLEQIEKEKRLAAEAAKRAAEIDAKNKLEQVQLAKNLAQLKKDCQIQGEKLASAMLVAALTEDRSQLDVALLDADDFMRLAMVQSAEEKKVFGKLTGFIKNLNKELKNLQNYKRRLAHIRNKHNLYLTLQNKNVALVEQILPGEIFCRMTDNDRLLSVAFHTLPASSRNSFIKTVSRRFKTLNNPGFFIGVLSRHVDSIALKDMPAKGFWKDYWDYFAKELHKK